MVPASERMPAVEALVRIAGRGRRTVEDIKQQDRNYTTRWRQWTTDAPQFFLARMRNPAAQKVSLAAMGWVRLIECQAEASAIEARDIELVAAARELVAFLAAGRLESSLFPVDPNAPPVLLESSSWQRGLTIGIDGTRQADDGVRVPYKLWEPATEALIEAKRAGLGSQVQLIRAEAERLWPGEQAPEDEPPAPAEPQPPELLALGAAAGEGALQDVPPSPGPASAVDGETEGTDPPPAPTAATETEEPALRDAKNEELDAMLRALLAAQPAGKTFLVRDTDVRPHWRAALRQQGLRSEWKAVDVRLHHDDNKELRRPPHRPPKQPE